MRNRNIALLLCAALTLSGCSTVKGWMGLNSNDESVLPGTREDVLPPQQLPRNNPAGKIASPDAPCEPADPNYPECLTPDSAAGAGGLGGVDEESAVPQQ
jgi:hypothetical protein